MEPIIRPLAALLLLLLALPASADSVYSFGVVPQLKSPQLIAIWTPILEELERRTGLRFELHSTEGIPEFERDVLTGRFDFAYVNPYQFSRGRESQGYRPLVRDGGRSLTGILVVPANSPIRSVADLDGKKIAFPSPRALAASLMIRSDLHAIHSIDFQPVYVRSHSNVYDSVLLGYAAAGGGVVSTLRQQGPLALDVLRVLYKTREVPPHPVVAHARIPAAHHQAVSAALLEMAANEQGAALLARIPMLQPVSAGPDDYELMEELELHQ